MQYPNASNVHVLRPESLEPQVQHMPAGCYFAVRDHHDRIYTRLSHEQLDVADAADIWCVVIATNPGCPLPAGALCKFPRATIVQPCELASPLQLAAQ